MTTYTHSIPTAELDQDLRELAQRIDCTPDELSAIIEGDQTGTDYTDDDGLTDEGRETLMLQMAHSTEHDLIDSATNEVIRTAIFDETVESWQASAEGHIEVDGRTVYVR